MSFYFPPRPTAQLPEKSRIGFAVVRVQLKRRLAMFPLGYLIVFVIGVALGFLFAAKMILSSIEESS